MLKKEGDEIKVETQGAMGIENKLSSQDIEDADVVIFAVDTSVSGKERFVGKKSVKNWYFRSHQRWRLSN